MNEIADNVFRAVSAQLWEVLNAAARRAIAVQGPDGRMPAGRNGPYNDTVTPVRNTAHWLCLFAALAERDRDPTYRRAAGRCGDYLCSAEARPDGTLFENRIGGAKDRWNGLIGQVWALEALLMAGTCLGRSDCLETFFEVLAYLPFDEAVGLWRLAPRKTGSRLVLTLNQQIWMASLLARSVAAGYEMHRAPVQAFLTALARYVQVRNGGVLRQVIVPQGTAGPRHCRLALFDPRNIRVGHHLQALYRRLRWGRLIDLGYHAFTLFGLAHIKQVIPTHACWTNPMLQLALDVSASETFLHQNLTNPFGSGYHLVGIETAFSLLVFAWGTPEERAERIRRCVTQDLETRFDRQSARMAADVTDAETVTARLYEAVVLSVALDTTESAMVHGTGE